MEEQHEQIIKKIFRHPGQVDLHISRLPQETKELFMEYSKGFCGDYGMALKYLLDFTLNFGPALDQVHQVLAEHELVLGKLLVDDDSNPTGEKRNLLGKQIRTG